MNLPDPSRRQFLHAGLTAVAAAASGSIVSACSTSSPSDRPGRAEPPSTSRTSPAPSTAPSSGETTSGSAPSGSAPSKVLLAYFSRPGENYYDGGRRDLEVGNTEVLARRIAGLIDADVFRIEAADPYPSGYDQTVARNVREQGSNARPEIVRLPASIESYDRVLIGSPIWNVQPPMIMATFADRYDFTGKTVLPFVTYAVSGLGRAQDFYTRACRGARFGRGLAVQGEEVAQSGADPKAWLDAARLTC